MSWATQRSRSRAGQTARPTAAAVAASSAPSTRTASAAPTSQAKPGKYRPVFARAAPQAQGMVVHLDGLALLQIAKHCHEALPTLVAGALLGLEREDTLEVTHSFATSSGQTAQDDSDDDADSDVDADVEEQGGDEQGSTKLKYEKKMELLLREVNVDNNMVGWYRSTRFMGGFMDKEFVDSMYGYYMRCSPNSVVLIFDPFFSLNGNLLLKAFRLRHSFAVQYAQGVFTQAALNSMGQSSILEEIPIQIKNSPLAKLFLWDLRDTLGPSLDCDFERLDLSTNPFLEKNLDFMIDCVDELVDEQDNIRYQKRKIAEKKRARLESEGAQNPAKAKDEKIRPPNRLKSLLVSSKINNYCAQMNRFTSDSFSRLFLAGSIHKE